MSTKPCRGCGMPIEFVRGPAGKMIPAQRIQSFYVEVKDLSGEAELQKLEFLEDGRLFVSHFETCPNATRFSGKK